MSLSFLPRSAQTDRGYSKSLRTCCAHGPRRQTYPLSAHNTHPPSSSNHTERGGDEGSVGYFPTTHQSCLTSPAVPALMLIILSTLNDSYWATIIPLNVTPVYYNIVYPTTGWLQFLPLSFPLLDHTTFLSFGRLSFQDTWPVSLLPIGKLFFCFSKHSLPLAFLSTGQTI